MDDVSRRLAELGDALYEATQADLATSRAPSRKRRRWPMALVAGAVIIPASAIAASGLLSSEDVARSLPAGTLALVGTTPKCEVVVDQVEYHCVLDEPPAPAGASSAPSDANRPALRSADRPYVSGPRHSMRREMADDWFRAAEPSVDSTNHVNGGCRALDATGMTWQCYIGEAAVEEGIISRQFLGERVRGPGVG
jgi:hypothetical protein